MRLMKTLTLLGVLLVAGPIVASSAPMTKREGWRVIETDAGFSELVQNLEANIKANKMNIVSVASASDGAKAEGIDIPGNRVVGVYRNDYARRMLEASLAAGIEAPIRFYVTADENGTATLSYKLPSTVFAPYFDEGGDELRKLATELDEIFAKIADDTIKS
jgi:uncharacterized protein (DUF302 family)